MIYFDNAATTMHKPDCVVEAVSRALETFGGAGRGVHPASLASTMAIHKARSSVARLLGAPSSKSVAFGLNATMALNVAIDSLLPDGGVAVTTAASHNSVLRPLFRARDERGCEVRIVPVDGEGHLDYGDLRHAVLGTGSELQSIGSEDSSSRMSGFVSSDRENIRESAMDPGAFKRRNTDGRNDDEPHSDRRHADLVAVTHASNLTGEVYDIGLCSQIAHDAGAILLVDGAQTAGSVPVNMSAQGIDVFCFTGHKSLYGPQGTGGLCVADGIEIKPLLEGGTGIHSFDERQPCFMPDSLEAGTPNGHGIAGLGAGVDWILEQGVESVHARGATLLGHFLSSAKDIPGIRIYGSPQARGRFSHSAESRIGVAGDSHANIFCDDIDYDEFRGTDSLDADSASTGFSADESSVSFDWCPTVAFNIGDLDSGYVTDRLAQEWGICARGGVHCAPLMHRALGTAEQGAVRFSFSAFNTEEEIDLAVAALRRIAAEA